MLMLNTPYTVPFLLAQDNRPVNVELDVLSHELESRYSAGLLDGYGLYLYGVVLKESNDKAAAVQVCYAMLLIIF